MGISSALNAGVQGLSANASKLATISDNIANSETNGYKRADVEFSSLVLGDQRRRYDAGGVRIESFRDVDARGALLATDNVTDIAITGPGFLPVTTIDAVEDVPTDRPLRLLTTGSFRQDSAGYLQTRSGQVLMGYPAVADGSFNVANRQSAVGLAPIKIEDLALASDPTTEITLAATLPAKNTITGNSAAAIELPIEYYDNIGGAQTLTAQFTPVQGATRTNQWNLTFADSGGGSTSPLARLTFDDSAGAGGALVAVDDGGAPAAALANYDAASGDLTVSVGPGDDPIAFNIAALTQLDAPFTPVSIENNGAPAATLAALDLSETGVLEAVYNSGFRRPLYQIPLGAVPNANGLKAVDGQAYEISRESGPIFFYDAGDGPTGRIASNALEESTTDVAEELTQLIQTQRAYSSNAKIIQTVDEMLQETTNIKR